MRWLVLASVMVGCKKAPPTDLAQAVVAGLYVEHCASCHGERGGKTFPGTMMGTPSFTSTRFWERPTDRFRGSVVAGGPAMGLRSTMPAFGGTLTEQQVDQLLAYIERFRP